MIYLTQLRDFYNPLTRRIHTFLELRAKHDDLPNTIFYQHLQMRHYALKMIGPQLPINHTPLDTIMATRSHRKGLISDIYGILTMDTELSFVKYRYMLSWEQFLGEELSLNDYNMGKPQEGLKVNYKILPHWYMTPAKLHSIYPATTASCWRQCGEEGTLYHIFWTCPISEDYWKGVLALLEPLLGQPMHLDPQTFLLVKPFPGLQKHIQKQKKSGPPMDNELKVAIQDVRRMEYLAALHRSQLMNFDKVRSQWDMLHPTSNLKG
ncbi:hypothetical protein XELAEV_18030573mg [Xenopus laevis]|uniref:Uncharacterized protein n=1 Tax=Xenopus laevis TaxID=8355 RepID=A0A974HEX6_XENLA|nr:hypothetical protein XELAEV_18030573mg [Xenopus laevis]